MFKKFLVSVSIGALAVALLQLADVQPAAAYPTSNVTLTGHGFGHGRGLGQYGALGYAIDDSWSYTQILDRYYGGTSFGAPSGDPTIGVRITGADAIDMILTAGVDFTVGGQAFSAGQAARVRKLGSNNFAIDRSADCGGGGGWNQISTTSGGVTAISSAPGNPLANVLQLCMPSGTRGYRGVLQAIDDSGTARVVNSLHVQEYLRGVIPRESPASWADLGGGKGAQALRAQTVAARSYVLSAASYSYATTCDTTACQVYGGAYLNGAYIEDTRSDAAIGATDGQVRRNGAGAVQRTEFSSSTGGYTAGGTFPAVVDDGDDTASNPNHNWTASIPVASVEAAYPSVGSLISVDVQSRNSLGDLGGRVTAMTVTGSSGTASITGADFRAKLGLKSDWFQVTGTPSGGTNGYWLIGNDGGVFSFGLAQFYGSMGGRPLNKPIINLAPAPGSQGYWLVASDGGIFTYGTSRFYGSMGGRPLNKPIVGMAPTPTGQGYWLVASDGGIFAYGDAQFYGSMGGRPLNKPIVGMAPTPTGQGYWLVASDGGIFAYGDAQFYGSTGSISLRQPVVGISATPSGHGYVLAAADGGIFAYGDAPFLGSLPASNINATVTGVARTATGNGYMLSTNNGTVHSFGDAPQFGGLSGYRGTVLGIGPAY